MSVRLKAFTVHITLSLLVVLAFFAIVFFVWYPSSLFELHRVTDVLKIVIFVDFILGPILTAIVFNPVKPVKELVRDVSVIVIVQLTALVWGMYITLSMRPQFVVYYDGSFYSVTNKDADLEALRHEVYKPHFWQKPELVYAPLPKSPQEIINEISELFSGGASIAYKAEFYETVAGHEQDINNRSLNSDFSVIRSRHIRECLQGLVENNQVDFSATRLYPFYGRYADAVVSLDSDNMQLVGVYCIEYGD